MKMRLNLVESLIKILQNEGNDMDLVIDANILFSVLIKSGKTEELIFDSDLHLFAPEFIFDEFAKYKEFILTKTERSDLEFEHLLVLLKKCIILVSNEESEKFIAQAKKISPDPHDVDYFALALKMRCAIWSNDKDLKKQTEVLVYPTEDLVKMF